MPLPPNDPSHVAGPPVRLQLTGALDILTAPEELERILVEGRHAGDCVELDLGGVEFIDSSGISMLIEARNHFDTRQLRARRGEPVEGGPPPPGAHRAHRRVRDHGCADGVVRRLTSGQRSAESSRTDCRLRREREVEQVRVDLSVGTLILAVCRVPRTGVGEEMPVTQGGGDALGRLERCRRVAGLPTTRIGGAPGAVTGSRAAGAGTGQSTHGKANARTYAPLSSGSTVAAPAARAASASTSSVVVGWGRSRQLTAKFRPRSTSSTNPWANSSKRLPSPCWPWAMAS